MGDLLHQLGALAAQQQVATGMVAAAIAGAAAWSLRALPGRAWMLAQDLFSVTLVVEGRDELYPQLNLWLASGKAARRSQRLIAQDDYDYEAGRWGWKLTLGRGWHIVRFRGWPLFVNREVMEPGPLMGVLGGPPNQRLWIVSPGRSQAQVRALIAEAEALWNGDGLVKVYFWTGGRYLLADRRPPRPLETVFLPASQKARLVADVEAFRGAKETYRRRGTPYRRGYLFEGVPGTGKTSLIFALAGMLKRSVYVVNLAAVGGDNDLMAAFNEVGADGVLVIEDVDAAQVSHDRSEVKMVTAAPLPSPGFGAQAAAPLTLSGLLNAVDGVAAREGRLLFMTSNHAGKLDPALLRPGRVDLREVIAPLGHAEAWEMFRAWRGSAADRAEFRELTDGRLPIVAAELANLLQGEDAQGEAEVIDLREVANG